MGMERWTLHRRQADMKIELNGRPAARFIWTISERQFQVVMETEQGPELMAVSSSWSTIENCFSDMCTLGTGQAKRYRIVEET